MKKYLSLIAFLIAVITWTALPVQAQNRIGPVSAITDTPAVTLTTAAVNSSITPTTGMHQAHISIAFGTVSGAYSTCTVQASTTYDGTTYLTLGAAASVAFATSTTTAFDLYGQIPSTTAVTLTTPSTTAATNFGLYTRWRLACSSYGTSAPVTLSVIYTP